MHSIEKGFNSMHKLRAGLLALLCVAAMAGCKTNTNPGDIKFLPPVIQLAVGTLNDSAATLTGAAGVYLNAVTTFRNNFGASAFLNPGTATLTGPGAISVTLGGLFSYGKSPGTNGVVGQPPAYVPPSTSAAGGYATGFILTGLTPPTSGGYTVVAPVTVNGQVQPWNASATLPATPTILGAMPAPAYAPVAGTGGGTFTVAPPSGVTETLIVILSGTTQVATVEAIGTTATVPPGTLAAGSYTAFAIGADYPLVEAGPPANVQQAPTITGAGGTADLTASGIVGITQT